MNRRSLLGSLPALWLAPGAVVAQQLATISFRVAPDMPVTDAPLEIRGRAEGVGQRIVRIVVRKPDQSIVELDAPLSGADMFKLDFADTHEAGFYEVEAMTVDGRGRTKLRVEVFGGSS